MRHTRSIKERKKKRAIVKATGLFVLCRCESGRRWIFQGFVSWSKEFHFSPEFQERVVYLIRMERSTGRNIYVSEWRLFSKVYSEIHGALPFLPSFLPTPPPPPLHSIHQRRHPCFDYFDVFPSPSTMLDTSLILVPGMYLGHGPQKCRPSCHLSGRHYYENLRIEKD